jgi:hypothetical protein
MNGATRESDRPIVETATQARQGVTGHNVRYVLLFSTVAVVIALAVVYALFFMH